MRVEQLGQALEDLAASQPPVGDGREGLRRRSQRRRHRRALGLAATLAAVGAAVLVWQPWVSPRSDLDVTAGPEASTDLTAPGNSGSNPTSIIPPGTAPCRAHQLQVSNGSRGGQSDNPHRRSIHEHQPGAVFPGGRPNRSTTRAVGRCTVGPHRCDCSRCRAASRPHAARSAKRRHLDPRLVQLVQPTAERSTRTQTLTHRDRRHPHGPIERTNKRNPAASRPYPLVPRA